MKKIFQYKVVTEKIYLYFVYAFFLGIFSAYASVSVISFLLISPVKVSPATVEKTQSSPNKLIVTDKNIFGIDARDEIIMQQMSNPGKQPNSFKAKLTGILAGAALEDSKAIILLEGEVYVINSYKEEGGMLLTEVSSDSILVSYNGQNYELFLENMQESATVHSINRTSFSQAGNKATQPKESAGTEQIEVHRGEVIEQLKDINSILRGVLITPMYVDKDFQGWRVSNLADDSPLRSLGIKKLDVINRINGEELTSPDILFSMLSTIDEITAVSIDITRNNQKKTLFVEIQ